MNSFDISNNTENTGHADDNYCNDKSMQASSDSDQADVDSSIVHIAAAEMARRLGAKYYVEHVEEDDNSNEDESIFSLESLRDTFISLEQKSKTDTPKNIDSAGQSDKNTDGIGTFSRGHFNIHLSDEIDNKTTQEATTGETLIDDFDEIDSRQTASNKTSIAAKSDVDVERDLDDADDVFGGGEGGGGSEVESESGVVAEGDETRMAVTPESIIEAMLFVGNRDNRPLMAEHAAEKMRNVNIDEIEMAVATLNCKYKNSGAPYTIVRDGGGYRMVLCEEFAAVQEKFYGRIREARLSQSAIDTLAVVAYKQPISADEVQTIRKQPSAALLSQLVKRGLIQIEREIIGKKKTLRYKTTPRFLELFQLDSIDDLPFTDDFDFK
ncbi:MAG: SMC-Scp complex subunit ScpB [Planctomycetaceae bacterium]|jgi:segregation and condensation protein B|nr:SMC-Scp complex subunit ScpB [Planctomycetaceae bacterium]